MEAAKAQMAWAAAKANPVPNSKRARKKILAALYAGTAPNRTEAQWLRDLRSRKQQT